MAISLSFLTSPPFRWSGGRLSSSIPNAVGDDLSKNILKYHYKHLRFDALVHETLNTYHVFFIFFDISSLLLRYITPAIPRSSRLDLSKNILKNIDSYLNFRTLVKLFKRD